MDLRRRPFRWLHDEAIQSPPLPRLASLPLIFVVLVTGCGSESKSASASKEGGAKMETSEHGTKIIKTTDRKTGLQPEIQDDSLYLKLPENATGKAAELRATGLGGACDVSSNAPFEMPKLFPIYWREDSNDWGTALVRGRPVPDEGGPTLAEYVTECRIYAPPKGSNEIRLENLVTTITGR